MAGIPAPKTVLPASPAIRPLELEETAVTAVELAVVVISEVWIPVGIAAATAGQAVSENCTALVLITPPVLGTFNCPAADLKTFAVLVCRLMYEEAAPVVGDGVMVTAMAWLAAGVPTTTAAATTAATPMRADHDIVVGLRMVIKTCPVRVDARAVMAHV